MTSITDDKIIQCKERATKVVTGLSSLELTHAEWVQLASQCEKHKIAQLSTGFIIRTMAEIRNVDYDDIVKSLTKKQHPRAAKTPVDCELPLLPKKRNFRKFNKEDDNRNPLILASTPLTMPIQAPLAKKGVRHAELTPASPERGYSDVKRTPGKTKVRVLFSNNVGSFFTPLTPYKPSGMVNTEHARRETITNRLAKLQFTRPEPLDFQATLPKLLARHHTKRSIGQNALMKASCLDVFAAHETSPIIKAKGSHYHWSHLVAHCLGGAQSEKNLVPATAASNYNTLGVIEQFIANKLKNRCTKQINIKVEPRYSGESLIPNEIVFQLNWQESNQMNKETIVINPRSYQRFTSSMHSSIEFLRQIATPTDDNDQQTPQARKSLNL